MTKPVHFITAGNCLKGAFFQTLKRLDGGLVKNPESPDEITAIMPGDFQNNKPTLEFLRVLGLSRAVYVDFDNMFSLLEDLPPLPHEYLSRLHIVVNHDEPRKPTVVWYSVKDAMRESDMYDSF